MLARSMQHSIVQKYQNSFIIILQFYFTIFWIFIDCVHRFITGASLHFVTVYRSVVRVGVYVVVVCGCIYLCKCKVQRRIINEYLSVFLHIGFYAHILISFLLHAFYLLFLALHFIFLFFLQFLNEAELSEFIK